MPARSRLAALAVALVLAACDPAPTAPPADAGTTALDAPPAVDAGPPPEPRADYGAPGPHPAGNARIEIVDRTGARTLPVELWYPALETARAAADTGQAIEAFESGTANESAIAELVAAAPASCVRARTRSAAAPDAAGAPASLPLVVFSHCHACTRYDVAEVAERLATHGIVVAAPDHVGNTLWDERAGMLAPVGSEFLEVRASDVASVLDRLLDASAAEIPASLRGRVDAARVGVMGHSFGAATTGLVVTTDPRFAAALAIAAPISALGGVRPTDVAVPYLFLLMGEDNSIGEIGNRLIRNDFNRISQSSWLVEVGDAGHWSISDLAGLIPAFAAGCGDGERQTMPGEPFTYVDPAVARELAADVAAAFFAIHLLGDPGGATVLARLDDGAGVAVTRRP